MSSQLPTMTISTFKTIITLGVLILFVVRITGFHFNDSRNISFTQLQPFNPKEYRILETSLESRRKLAPFQLCSLCKCCAPGGNPATCTSMPCCFGIDCQLPNKPFGVCAFVPKMCNCTTCAT